MKNASALILLSALVVLMAAIFFVAQQRPLPTFPASKGSAVPTSLSDDLRKTQTALQQLEKIQPLLSGTASKKPGPLLAVSTPAVAPPSGEAVRHEIPAVRAPESIFERAAWQSGYTVPVTATTPAASERQPVATTPAAAPKTSASDYRVSFIYISPDIKRAVINDVFVHEGETLGDGTRVLSIRGDQITLGKNGKRQTLTVPRIYAAFAGPSTK